MSDVSPHISANSRPPEDGAQLYDILPFTIDNRIFGVFNDQVESTVEAKAFSRLPRTPRAIVGVVCVRGRMLTVLDATAALKGEGKNWKQPLPHVIALRGDEQLGLAADSRRDTITVAAQDIEPSPDDATSEYPIVGSVKHGGDEILIFDTNRLFDSAVGRRERRRRRF